MALIGNLKGGAGSQGPAGPSGTAGTPGVAGTKWYFGVAAPSDAIGVDGDFYLNTTTADVYNKAGGHWA